MIVLTDLSLLIGDFARGVVALLTTHAATHSTEHAADTRRHHRDGALACSDELFWLCLLRECVESIVDRTNLVGVSRFEFGDCGEHCRIKSLELLRCFEHACCLRWSVHTLKSICEDALIECLR